MTETLWIWALTLLLLAAYYIGFLVGRRAERQARRERWRKRKLECLQRLSDDVFMEPLPADWRNEWRDGVQP